ENAPEDALCITRTSYAPDHAVYQIDSNDFTCTQRHPLLEGAARMVVNDTEYFTHFSRHELGMIVRTHAQRSRLNILPARLFPLFQHIPAKRLSDQSAMLIAPMPGQILRISVNVGDSVQAGQELCVLEAMKMENILRAPADTLIKSIAVNLGDMVQVDQVLMVFGK
ncbi:MAG: acetyl-CoA carboxylase biotin carboxyl carrier protein subunit, partial [Pseudomonadota bacterium]